MHSSHKPSRILSWSSHTTSQSHSKNQIQSHSSHTQSQIHMLPSWEGFHMMHSSHKPSRILSWSSHTTSQSHSKNQIQIHKKSHILEGHRRIQSQICSNHTTQDSHK